MALSIFEVAYLSLLSSYAYSLLNPSTIIYNSSQNVLSSGSAIISLFKFIAITLLLFSFRLLSSKLSYLCGYYFGCSSTKKLVNSFTAVDYSQYLSIEKSKILSIYIENVTQSVAAVNGLAVLVSGTISSVALLTYILSIYPINVSIVPSIVSLSTYILIVRLINKRVVKSSRLLESLARIRIDGFSTLFDLFKYNKIYDSFCASNEAFLANDSSYRQTSAAIPFLVSIGPITLSYGIYILAIVFLFFLTRNELSSDNASSLIALGLALQRLVPSINLMQSSQSTVLSKSVFMSSLYQTISLFEMHKDAYAPEIFSETGKLTCPHELIRLTSVNYRYPGSPLLYRNNININIKQSTRLLIKGPSGSGKSTLIDIILSLKSPSCGSVEYGSSFKSISRLISYSPQQPYAMNASLRDNLSLGLDAPLNYDQVQDVLSICCLLNLFNPQYGDFLDIKIGAGGLILSGGQLQRLSIARALLRDSPVLLLDEPTNALDNQLSLQLMDNIFHYTHTRGIALIVVSHDTSLFDKFNCTIDLSS